MIMQVAAENGVNLALRMIEYFEGDELAPYQDIRGIWTYGYGMTTDLNGNPVTANTPPLTQAQAEAGLYTRVEHIFSFVINGIQNDWMLDCMDAALISFIYNIGENAFSNSTIHRLLMNNTAENHEQMERLASEQFPMWCHAGNKINTPLLHRRAIERAVFNGVEFDQAVLLVTQVTSPVPLKDIALDGVTVG